MSQGLLNEVSQPRVASTWNFENEVEQIYRKASKIGHADRRDEALSSVAKALAKTRSFDRAREIVIQIGGTFWKADTLIIIASFSGEAEDFFQAREMAEMIYVSNLKEDALGSIEDFESVIDEREFSQADVLTELEEVLVRLAK